MREPRAWRSVGAAIAAAILASSLIAPGRAQDKVGTSLDAQDFGQIERGRYLANAGDCASCHTVPGTGQPFAGGRPIETPFGTWWAPTSRPTAKPASAPGATNSSSGRCARARGMTASGSIRRCHIPITPG